MLTDRPIEPRDRDELGTRPFVQRLIRPLMSWPATEGFVMGLYGPWGHGKTSALNLLYDELSRWEGEGPSAQVAVVVRFNPWLYSTSESLLLSFFGTLAEALGTSPLLRKAHKRALGTALQGIGEFITLPAVASTNIGAIGAGKTISIAAKRLLESGEAELTKQKTRAAKTLLEVAQRGRRARVVVLIDDLDRAQAGEIRTMLRVVRLIADLPNISYVLAMDESRVRAVLGEDLDDEYGAAFLEKIVQVPISLPVITSERMAELVQSALEEVFGEAGYPRREIFSRWTWSDGLPYDRTIGARVHTLRDRARLINDLRFLLLTTKRRIELDPADALLISFLHTFFPDVYLRIRRNKRFFTEGTTQGEFMVGYVKGEDEARKVREDSFRRVLGVSEQVSDGPERWIVAPEEGTIVLEVARHLFPRMRSGNRNHDTEALLRRENRIESPDRFDRYFHVLPSAAEVSDEFVELLMADLTTLLQADDGRSVTVAAERLRLASTETQDAHASLIQKIGDRVPEISDLLADADPTMDGVLRLAQALLISQDVLGTDAVSELTSYLATYRAQSEYLPGTRELGTGVRVLTLLVEQLSDVYQAVAIAADVVRSNGGLIVPNGNTEAIAAAIVQRMEELSQSSADPLTDLSDSQFSKVIWGWYASLIKQGLDPTPVRAAVEHLIELHPERIPRLLQSTGAQTASGPELDPENSPAAAMERISKLHDVDSLVHPAQSLLERGGNDADPHGLVREFLNLYAEARQVRSEGTDQQLAPGS